MQVSDSFGTLGVWRGINCGVGVGWAFSLCENWELVSRADVPGWYENAPLALENWHGSEGLWLDGFLYFGFAGTLVTLSGRTAVLSGKCPSGSAAPPGRVTEFILSNFGRSISPAPTPPASFSQQRLVQLISSRQKLLDLNTQERNRSEHHLDAFVALIRKLVKLTNLFLKNPEASIATSP